MYESIVKGNPLPGPGIPEAFRVLIKEFQALGLNISVINNDDEESARAQVGRFCELFGFKADEKSASTFASDEIEVCRKRFPGTHGHIAIGTGNVERAVYYLEKKGVEFDFSTAKYKGDRLTSVYLTECIGGFAIHLVEK